MRKFKISAADLPLVFSTVVPTAASELQVKVKREDNGTQSNAVAPDGSDRVVYRTPLIGLEVDDRGEVIRHSKEVTVALLRPSDLKFGVIYEAQGNVYLVPWIREGRIAWSITLDGVIARGASDGSGSSNASPKKDSSAA